MRVLVVSLAFLALGATAAVTFTRSTEDHSHLITVTVVLTLDWN